MEEGSLLQHALQRQGFEEASQLHNTLWVDVFLLKSYETDEEGILALTTICVDLNDYVQSQDYPWWSGGDGSVFGVATTEDDIVHLRGACHYGVSVADEWKLISITQDYTKRRTDIAVKVWDVDDGDVLIIQGSESLPEWVYSSRDEISLCQNRCWLHEGLFYWIEPPTSTTSAETDEILALSDALAVLRSKSPKFKVATDSFHEAIVEKTRSCSDIHSHRHRAALVVPRSVANLLDTRPDLVSAVVVAFSGLLDNYQPSTVSTSNPTEEWDDWVWTTHRFGRTHYALLRTAVSSSPDWRTADSIPPQYRSIEVQRRKRQASVEATPHLHSGVSLGVRLVAGLDALLSQEAATQHEGSALERRGFQYWPRLLGKDASWIAEAFQAGPRNAKHNVEYLLKCPIYPEEFSSITPLSHPDLSVQSQVRSTLKKGRNRRLEDWQEIPRAQDVDVSEDWMTFPDEASIPKTAGGTTGPTRKGEKNKGRMEELGTMLKDVHSFFAGTSNVEGVTHDDEKELKEQQQHPIQINPSVFLGILHATLKAKTTNEMSFLDATTKVPETDPYFSQQDYDLMEGCESSSDEEDTEDDLGAHTNTADAGMAEIMKAMDRELLGSNELSRGFDGPAKNSDDAVGEGSHVLSNLLQSLEAGGGGPGPIRNMLQEMNKDVPDLTGSGGDDSKGV